MTTQLSVVVVVLRDGGREGNCVSGVTMATHDNPVFREDEVDWTGCIPVCSVVDGCPGNAVHQVNTGKS